MPKIVLTEALYQEWRSAARHRQSGLARTIQTESSAQRPIVPPGDEEVARMVQAAFDIYTGSLLRAGSFMHWGQANLETAVRNAMFHALNMGIPVEQLDALASFTTPDLYRNLREIRIRHPMLSAGLFVVYHDIPYYLSTLHRNICPDTYHRFGHPGHTDHTPTFLVPPPDMRNRALLTYPDENPRRDGGNMSLYPQFWDARTVTAEDVDVPSYQAEEFYAALASPEGRTSCLVGAQTLYRYPGSLRPATLDEVDQFFGRLIIGSTLAYGQPNLTSYLMGIGVSASTVIDAGRDHGEAVPSLVPSPLSPPGPASPTVNTDARPPVAGASPPIGAVPYRNIWRELSDREVSRNRPPVEAPRARTRRVRNAAGQLVSVAPPTVPSPVPPVDTFGTDAGGFQSAQNLGTNYVYEPLAGSSRSE